MNAKLSKISEMEAVLSVKDERNVQLLQLFGRFGLGNLLRHLSLEKHAGVSAATIIVSLCLFLLNGESIYSAYRKRYHGLLKLGKNCFYRMMTRPCMDWRRLMLGTVRRFEAILRKEHASGTDAPRCFILDDTTIEKSGFCIEKISRVHDHVSGRFVLGFKLLLLAVSDGVSTLPVDFSLHREKGRKGDCGLTEKQRRNQYKVRRKDGCPNRQREKECDMSKLDVAVEMLARAWKHGIRASYVLADSWFCYEKMIAAVRKLGRGAVHYVGLAKMDRTRYCVCGRQRNAHELVALYSRQAVPCRKYKCLYVCLRGTMGTQPVRIYLIKYGRNENWNIMLSSDTAMKFNYAFELYQMRWSIEVLNKECKGYLGLGEFQGRNFDGQIAGCTLCFITYTVLALGKRFSSYETLGELFREERRQLQALTLWRRTLECIERLLAAVADMFSMTAEQLMQALIMSDKAWEWLNGLADLTGEAKPKTVNLQRNTF